MRLSSVSAAGAVTLIAAAASTAPAPVAGDENSCGGTTASADGASGAGQCPQSAVDAPSHENSNELPIWWDWNIDQLFEDYFDCGSILAGYEDEEYDDDDDSGDYEDDDYNPRVSGKPSGKNGRSNPVSKDEKVIDESHKYDIQQIRQQWREIREKYVREINLVPIKHARKHLPAGDSGTGPTNYVQSVSALVVPTEVKYAGRGRGRGVFSTEPIPRGTLVVNLDNGSTGIFKDGRAWREFTVSLPKETACNFIEWCWVQRLPPANERDSDVRNGLTVFVAFDESNLMNDGTWDGVEPNIRCGTPPTSEGGEWGPCRFHYYATRDIDAGEELLLSYGEFEDEDQNGWTDMGL